LLAKKSIVLQVPKLKPEIGALIGAFHESGNIVSDSVIDHFLKYR
jgi:hypothetical protein